MINSTQIILQPKFIRLKDAPFYLGMDRNRFSAEVRPFITEIPIGKQGIAFDKLDLDDFAEQYKIRNGRPSQKQGDHLWDARKRQASPKEAKCGTLINESMELELSSLLEQAASTKRKNI